MANEEQKVFLVDSTVTSPNGEVNARVALVDAAGDPIPAAGLPALPTADGNYQLTVTSGVYSWTEIV